MLENSPIKTLSEIETELAGENYEEQQEKESSDPRLNEKYSFELNFKDRRGKIWSGRFTNKILTIQEQFNVNYALSSLTGKVPIDSIQKDILITAQRISHLMISLIEKPDWAKDLTQLKTIDVIDAIYQEVDSHEAIFFGHETA